MSDAEARKTRQMLEALAWSAVGGFIRQQAKKGRAGRHRKKRAHLAKNGTMVGFPRESPSKSSVYVIGAAGHPVKVGVAKCVTSRIADLQTGCHFQLRAYHAHEVPEPLALKVERRAHELLAASRLHGEWFDVRPEDASTAVLLAITQVVPTEF